MPDYKTKFNQSWLNKCDGAANSLKTWLNKCGNLGFKSECYV